MISVILLIKPFQDLKNLTVALSKPLWTTEPKTDILLILSRTVKEKRDEKGFGKDILVKCGTKPYLDRVENATRKAVFPDSFFKVSNSFWPKFSMCLNMTETSYVAQYLGIGGLCCQKTFVAIKPRECWPIGMLVSLTTTWYLLMAEKQPYWPRSRKTLIRKGDR